MWDKNRIIKKEVYEIVYKDVEGMIFDKGYTFIIDSLKRDYRDKFYGLKLFWRGEAKLPLDCKLVFNEETNKYLLSIDNFICGCIRDEDTKRLEHLLEKHSMTNVYDLKCKVIDIHEPINDTIGYKIILDV